MKEELQIHRKSLCLTFMWMGLFELRALVICASCRKLGKSSLKAQEEHYNLTFPEKITSDALVYTFWNPSCARIFTVYYFFSGKWDPSLHKDFYEDCNQGRSNSLNLEGKKIRIRGFRETDQKYSKKTQRVAKLLYSCC